MKEDCLISIIVPIYNVEKYLNKCIDSIISQTYKNIEIILVDDGSPDNCGKICDEYAKKDNRIKVIHKENGGVSSARNVGIENSNGEWIAFVDADDWIEKEYIFSLANKAKDENADIALCTYNRVTGNIIEKINNFNKKNELNAEEYLIMALNPQTGFGYCWIKLFKKNIIKDTRFDRSLLVAEDALFNIQISKNINKAVVLSENLYNYRNNENSVVKKFDEKYVKKYLNAMKKNKKYIFDNYQKDSIKQSYYNFVAFHVMLIAVNYCYHPENKCKNKRKLLKEICEQDYFDEGIKKSNYEHLSLTRKISLFTLKHKLYILTELICEIRQKQNDMRRKK